MTSDMLGQCMCSCCDAARVVIGELQAMLRAVEDRAANDRRERDEALARLPHGGYGPVHADPPRRWR